MRDQLRDGWRQLLNFANSRWEATREWCCLVYVDVSRKVARIRNSSTLQWQIGSLVLPLLAILGGVLFYTFFRESLQQTSTLVGLFLQVVGIVIAIKGLRDLRELFNSKGIRESIESLLSPPYRTLVGTGVVQTSVHVEIENEEKDESVESNLEKLRETVEELKQRQGKSSKTLEDLYRELSETNDKLKELEGASVGNLNLETIGLIWLLVGSVLFSLPAFL